MGRTLSSIADDASAIYWNPAGLARISEPQILLTTYRPFFVEDLSLNFSAVAYPTRLGTFWAAWSRLALTDVVSEDMIYWGGAREIRVAEDLQVSIGGSLKLLRVDYKVQAATGSGVHVDLGSETSIGGDLGIQAKLTPKMTVGYAARNVGNPRFDFIPGNGQTVVDVVHEAGLAYFWNPESKVAVALVEDGEESLTPVLGTEIFFFDVFALRAGVGDLKFFGGVGIQSDRDAS
jgi:hypothetical protein